LRKPVFSKLFNIAEVSNLNRQEKMAYDSSLKQKWDLQNSFDYVEKEGFQKGVAEGRKEGVRQEKLDIARNMKVKGLDFILIAELLDLPVETIENL
jgi:predicted transposase/invertase (TIGR01784 family)